MLGGPATILQSKGKAMKLLENETRAQTSWSCQISTLEVPSSGLLVLRDNKCSC